MLGLCQDGRRLRSWSEGGGGLSGFLPCCTSCITVPCCNEQDGASGRNLITKSTIIGFDFEHVACYCNVHPR